MSKKILVCFGEEKREVHYEDVKNLIPLFRNLFKIPLGYNITLQKFNKEWDEWVNIELEEIESKTKIKVITSVQLELSNEKLPELLYSSSMQSMHTSVEETDSQTDTVDSLILVHSQGDESTSSTVSEGCYPEEMKPTTSGSTHNSPDIDNKTATGRVKMEFKPWPKKFEIPVQNMSPQLKKTLSENSFPSDKLRKQLIQVLYDEMFQYGRYPTRNQYEIVASELVKVFPILGQHSIPTAKPYDYWKMKLSDKFRNERKSVYSDEGPKQKKPKLKKTPGGKLVEFDPHPIGEDVESIAMHIKWMQEEKKKKRPDLNKIANLMEVTFYARRQDIMNKMLVSDAQKKYPYLLEPTQIHREFQRITGTLLDCLTNNLRLYVEGLLNYQYKDRKTLELATSIREKLETLPSQEKKEEFQNIVLILIPGLFRVDHRIIMGFPKEQSDMTFPYLLFNEEHEDLFLVTKFCVTVEGNRVQDVGSLLEGIQSLIAVYWIFDMVYPQKAKDFFNFVETALLNIKSVKPTRSVSTVMTKII